MNIESTGRKKAGRKTFRKWKSKDEQRKSRPMRVPIDNKIGINRQKKSKSPVEV